MEKKAQRVEEGLLEGWNPEVLTGGVLHILEKAVGAFS